MAVSLLPSRAAQLISREKLLSRASRAATWKQLRSGRAGGVIHPLAHTNMCRVCAGALGGNNWRCDVTGLRWTSGASQATQQHLDALGRTACQATRAAAQRCADACESEEEASELREPRLPQNSVA